MLAKPFSIEWFDDEREPQEPANPAFPDGIDVDVTGGAKGCKVELPYPAQRCGKYVVSCNTCGVRAVITTAGRDDDPRSLKLPCKERVN